jgi:hypothetical protein
MTSRSGQEREPPRFVDLDLLHVDSAFRRRNQMMFPGLLLGGYKRAAISGQRPGL